MNEPAAEVAIPIEDEVRAEGPEPQLEDDPSKDGRTRFGRIRAASIASLLAGWVAAYVVIGQRLYLSRGPGEAVGTANVVTIVLLASCLVLGRRSRRDAVRRFSQMPVLIVFLLAWTVLSLLAPVVGYPVHTLFSATVPLAIAAFVLFGSYLAETRVFDEKVLPRCLAVVAWLQFLPGLLQPLWYTHLLRTPVQAWLYAWDTRASDAFGVMQIAGRSVGLYLNPNVYSLLGGLLLVLGMTLPMRKVERAFLVVPAAGIVILGASRGVLLSLLLLAIPYAFMSLRRVPRHRLLRVAPALVGGLVLLHVLLSLAAGPVYARFTNRWTNLPAVLAHGTSADGNAQGRVEAWSKAVGEWKRHPLGSFGPPQMMLASFTDNDYITMLLQGGPILLFAYAGTLWVAFRRRECSRYPAAVAGTIGLISLTGFTQTSVFFLPAIALFWPLVGTTLLRHEMPPDAEGPRTRQDRRAKVQLRKASALLALVPAVLAILALTARLSGGPVVMASLAHSGIPASAPRPHARPRPGKDLSDRLPATHLPEGGRLGAYYVDLPGQVGPDDWTSPVLTDAEEARLAHSWHAPSVTTDGKSQVIAIGVAINGLHDYSRYTGSGEETFALFARKAADWLVQQQKPDGSWRYPERFEDLAPQWSSVNVQSVAISLLCREYQDTGREEYLGAARLAHAYALTPIDDGGTRSYFADGKPVLEGYAGSRTGEHALSGALIGLFGEYDLEKVTQSTEVRQSFATLSASLAEHLPEYDIDGWSRYSLGQSNGPAPDNFHRLYISELRVAGKLSGDQRFARFADRWTDSLQTWTARHRDAGKR